MVFFSGFAVMVLEIVGARYLAKDFGSSFYVWTSQIGVVLIALALGYVTGGALADRWQRATPLMFLLAPAGGVTLLIPELTPPVIDAIVLRHPPDQDIAPVWQKLDPALGSAVLFLLPCFALAVLPPYMIRLSARRLQHVGFVSGLIYGASTAGSIAGVFVSGYVLIDQLPLSTIFRVTGVLTLALGTACVGVDRWRRSAEDHEHEA